MSILPDAAGAVDGSRKGERRRGVLPVSMNLGIGQRVL